MLLAVTGVVGASSAAVAAVDGINVDVLYNGQPVQDDQTITTGDPLQIRVSYDAKQDINGEEITVSLPAGIDLDGALPNNTAVDSITDNGDGTYTVKFKDPVPSDVTEGAFVFNIKATAASSEDGSTISWEVGGEQTGVTIIVEDPDVPPFEIQEGYSKAVSPGNLNSFVQREQDENGDYYFAGLDPAIADQTLTYTLVINSHDAREDGYTIEDVLPAGLGFVSGSFSAVLTTYAPDGTPDEGTSIPLAQSINGTTFTGSLDGIPENSTVTITYEARVADVAALEAQLQEKFDALDGAPGNFGITLTNTATFGGDQERTANLGITGNIPGAGVGDNFAKWQSWDEQSVVADDDGVLEQPAQMTYTLHADLSPWDGRNQNFTLQRNVVISDTLIDQAEWISGDDSFIQVTSNSNDGLQSLTVAADCPSAEDFAADEYVGQYCVDGQQLLVNVGQDKATNLNITVLAQLNTLAGLQGSGDTTIIGGTAYPWPNRASFYYRDGDPANRDVQAKVVDLPDDYQDGLNDRAAFNKTATSDEVRVNPGESAEVGYRFDVNTARAGADVTKSRVVDEVDTDIFDLSDLSTVQVNGSYGNQGLSQEDFALSLDDDNNLVIELSDTGKQKAAAAGEGQQYTVNIVLTTIPFDADQKETFEIHNRATLTGEDGGQDYWSEDDSEATSFGDEAEMRKRLWDADTEKWVQDMDAPIKDGEFVNDVFTYSIELIPRGNYGSAFPVQIFTREDQLPNSLSFLGFVDADENGTPSDELKDEIEVGIGGNVLADYDADRNVVTIRQKDGTSLNPGEKIEVFFKVRATVPEGDIVNSIAGSDTTITPVGDPSIDIEKWNDEGDTPSYDDSGALTNDGYDGDFDEVPGKQLAADTPLPINFTISNDGREDLVDVTVSDELTDGKGEITDLVCTFPDESTGTEWAGPFKIGTQFDCTGTLPALASGDTHADLAKVTGTGIVSGEDVKDEDAWNGEVPVPSIDIEKWSDEGDTPSYDDSGALTNDGYDGDFDEAPGKQLAADTPLPINFTISNDGEEPLVNVTVSDELTDGKGEITDLVCTFPDESTGTEWAGPFEVGTQFDCTGTLPALEGGNTHADLSKVIGTGLYSGTDVDDEDVWNGEVPIPSVDIEKWSDEGQAPEYDDSGALTNDGYDGDFDKGKGKELREDRDQKINFTISNDGAEPLIDLVVSDELTDGKGEITDLVCTFPDDSTGTEWAGPLEVGAQFECTGTLPGLAALDTHADTAKVTAVGLYSGIGSDDSDDWRGFVPEKPSGLAITGGEISGIAGIAALLLLGGGALLVARRRRSSVN